MLLKVLERFNGRDEGAIFEAKDADAKKWIKMELAKKATKKEAEDFEKGTEEKTD